MSKELSIIIYDKSSLHFSKFLKNLNSFKIKKIILCVKKNNILKKNLKHKIFKKIIIYNKYILNDYGNITKNYLNELNTISKAIKIADSKNILILKNFNLIKKFELNLKKNKKRLITFNKHRGYIHPIQIDFNHNDFNYVFGSKRQLKILFDFKEGNFPLLFNTTIFPKKLEEYKDTYLTKKDFLIISYYKKILSNKKKNISFDEIIGNYSFLQSKLDLLF